MPHLRTALVSILATLAFVGLTGATKEPARQYIDPRSSASAPSAPPFSGAVRTGDTLYISGALGLDKESRVPEDPKEEARLALDSIRAKLDRAGMTMDDLVSVQIFCSDVAHYAAFNEVYKTYFKREYPARAFIGSGKLLYDARFEVQAIAVKT